MVGAPEMVPRLGEFVHQRGSLQSIRHVLGGAVLERLHAAILSVIGFKYGLLCYISLKNSH
jgi:hypothetical protein